ncbi:MAG: peptidylprolyl isomerase [Tissierellia bacterium]|nr:peptidylprolyl isomerase [Tissierellia bacterium]
MLDQLDLPKEGEEIAELHTNYGTIRIRLFPKIAPKAVENFTTHAKDGYYDGVTFHRVIKGFMIQGGDPVGTGVGGESIWGAPFEDEFHGDYHNLRGALSMANAGPNTNGSQFFIVQKNDVEKELLAQMDKLGEESGFSEGVVRAYGELGGTPHLDFRHTVFGQVFDGMDIVDRIASVKTGPGDKPVEPVIIERIEMELYG